MGPRFDTAGIPENDRFSYWHEIVCNLYCRADSRLLLDDGFDASLSCGSLGHIEIGDISCGAMHYDRTTADVRKSPSDDFLLSLLVEGEGWLTQQGRNAHQVPGDIVVYDTAQPFAYVFPEHYRMIILKIPRRTLLSRISDAERYTSVAISKHSVLGGLTSKMIQEAATLNLPGDSSSAAKIGTSIIDVISAAMEINLAGRSRDNDRQATLLSRAKDYIRMHLEDPQLDVDHIASAMCVSIRTLNRLFASDGTTVMRWLWRERVEQSHRVLSEGRATQVTDAALSCGFSSFSHFSRAFKLAYGIAPHKLIKYSRKSTQLSSEA